MALFTRKGDDGTTGFFGGDKRYSKNSDLAWALGTLDEINSFLGFCKARVRNKNKHTKGLLLYIEIEGKKYPFVDLIERVQQSLFIVQAELAGADKTISKEKVDTMEMVINGIEKQLPPITSFLVSGATETQALFDFARTIARRAERVVVGLPEKDKPSENTMAYLNRLSSLLYSFARFVAHKSGAEEQKPNYN